MSTAAAAALGSRIERGIVAVPRGTKLPAPEQMTFFPAGHPQPDEGSLACGQAIEAMLADTTAEDTLLTLVSGGGSAMLEIPVPGVTLEDLRSLNAALIRSGAPIQEINVVRSALSDVVGDRLSSIASGPTVLRAPSPHQAVRILQRNNLWKEIPAGVREALTADRAQLATTPRPVNLLIGNNRIVIEAAQASASEMGFQVRVLSRQMRGEAREVGRRMASRMAGAVGPTCLIMGGETTVRVRGGGRGGRNQELGLAAAIELDGSPRVALMSLATDGVDGPTDAAGAIVTGETAGRARQSNIDLNAALAYNDAYPCLDELGALIRTGPTGTNLNDIVVGLVYAR
jgi:glycerate 2-kinase